MNKIYKVSEHPTLRSYFKDINKDSVTIYTKLYPTRYNRYGWYSLNIFTKDNLIKEQIVISLSKNKESLEKTLTNISKDLLAFSKAHTDCSKLELGYRHPRTALSMSGWRPLTIEEKEVLEKATELHKKKIAARRAAAKKQEQKRIEDQRKNNSRTEDQTIENALKILKNRGNKIIIEPKKD